MKRICSSQGEIDVCLFEYSNQYVWFVEVGIITIHFDSLRDFYPTRYELKPDLSLEEPSDFNPPFNFTFQVRSTSLL